MTRIDAATQRQVNNSLTLAHQLGGTPLSFKGGNVVLTIASFVAEYGITHIVMGRSKRPWYRRWFGQSLLDRLLRCVEDVDVIVVASSEQR